MLPFTIVVEKGGSVTGLVVLIDPLQLGCACTILFERVAHHITFHDFDTWLGLFWFMKSTATSVRVVPIATGTLS